MKKKARKSRPKGANGARLSLVALCSTTLAGVGSGTVMAQDDQQADPQSEKIEDVVVYGRQAEYFKSSYSDSSTGFVMPLHDTPQSVSVVTSDFVRTIGLQRLDDVFDYVAGVANAGPEGYGGLESTLVARGRQIDTTRNYKLNGYTFSNRGTLEMAGVERVEFPKGPTSLIYGFGSYGGIVNLVTKQPQANFQGNAELSYGSFDELRVVTDVTGPLTDDKRMRFRLVGGYEDSDSFRDFQNRQSISFSPSLEYDFTDRTSLTLLGYYQDQEGRADSGIPKLYRDLNGSGFFDEGDSVSLPYDLPRSLFLGDPNNNHTEASIRSAVARLTHKLNDSTQLRANVSYSDSSNSIRSIYGFAVYAPVSADDGIIEVDSVIEEDDIESVVAEVSLSHSFEAMGRDHQLYLLGGYDHMTRDRYSVGVCQPEALSIFDLNFEAIDVPFATREQYETGDVCYRDGVYEKVKSWNAGAQVLMQLNDRLNVIVGGRYDKLDWFFNDLTPVGGEVLFDDTVDEFSFRVSALLKFNKALNGYAHFARGFQPQLGKIRGGGTVGNEHGEQVELGLKGEFNEGQLGVSLAVFQLNVKDQAISDPSNVPGENFVLPAGETRYRGAEFELLGQLTKGLTLAASYAYVESKVLAADDPFLQGRDVIEGPAHKAALVLDYAVESANKALDRLSFGGAVTWSGKQNQTPFFADSRIPSYALLNLHASYALTDRTLVQVNASNLLDKRYFLPGPVDYENLVFWGEPRAVRLSIRTTF